MKKLLFLLALMFCVSPAWAQAPVFRFDKIVITSNAVDALRVTGKAIAAEFDGPLVGNVTGNVTGDASGNAGTATKLQTGRAINGVDFDGTTPITITATASQALTFGTHLTGTSYNGSAPVTISTDAASANTPSTLVARDGSGNFTAGTISAALTGNADSATLAAAATKLATARNINGVAFDGTASISVAVTGGSCTNQVATAISSTGVPTCTTVTSSYVDNSIALTGADINISNQVTITHLVSALPFAQGGFGFSTATLGDLFYAGATNTPGKLADVATGRVLISGGVGVAPSWSVAPAVSQLTVNATGLADWAATFTADDLAGIQILPSGATSTALHMGPGLLVYANSVTGIADFYANYRKAISTGPSTTSLSPTFVVNGPMAVATAQHDNSYLAYIVPSPANGNSIANIVEDLNFNLIFQESEQTPNAPTVAQVTDGTGVCTAGTHVFAVTINTPGGQSKGSASSGSVTCDGTHTKVTVTIPIGSLFATSRNIYISKANTTTPLFLIAATTVNDNTTITYTFNTADGSLTATKLPTATTAFDTRLAVNYDGTLSSKWFNSTRSSSVLVLTDFGINNSVEGRIRLNGASGAQRLVLSATGAAATVDSGTMPLTVTANGFIVPGPAFLTNVIFPDALVTSPSAYRVEPNPTVAPTATLVATASGNCDNGAHIFAYRYVTFTGNTLISPSSNSVTCDASHKQVTVVFTNGTNWTFGGDAGSGGSNSGGVDIFASEHDAPSTLFLVSASPVIAGLAGGTPSTTYTYNIADASLTSTQPPVTNTTKDPIIELTALGSVSVGGKVSATGHAVSIGVGSNANYNGGSFGVAIGAGAYAGNVDVVIGVGSTGGCGDSTVVGSVSTAGCEGVAIGRSTVAVGGVVIGKGATNTANEFVSGASCSNCQITDVYIGNGITNAAPQNVTYHGSGGSGSNIAGADVAFAPGRGTGLGNSGTVRLQYAPHGLTGTALNALVDGLTLDDNGVLTIPKNSVGVTSFDAFLIKNATAASSILNQWSGRIHLIGNGWDTASGGSSQTEDGIIELQTVSGGNNTSPLLSFSLRRSFDTANTFINVFTMTTDYAIIKPSLSSIALCVGISSNCGAVNGAVSLINAGAFLWNTRSVISSPADGLVNITTANTNNGIGFDVSADAVFGLKTRAQTGYAALDTLGVRISGAAVTGTVLRGNGTNYVGSTLVAASIPSVVASTFEKSETGTDANVLTYTVGAADEFETVWVATDVSALTGTSVVVTLTWKDANNTTQTSTVTLSGVGDGTINVPINAQKSTNVVISTVFTGVSTAYKISAVVARSL